MSDQYENDTRRIDGAELEQIGVALREGVEAYRKDEDTVVLSTAGIREGDGPDGVYITLDELKNLLVDVQAEVLEDG